MDKSTYIAMEDALRARPQAARLVRAVNTAITRFVYAAYPCFIVWVFFVCGWPVALKAILIPAGGFLVITFIRKVINAPRPYEKFEAEPIIPKSTQGLSFPSRHTFSIFVIAMTVQVCSPVPGLGAIALVLACILGILRVIGGVHFPKDVLCAAVLGIAVGALELLF